MKQLPLGSWKLSLLIFVLLILFHYPFPVPSKTDIILSN